MNTDIKNNAMKELCFAIISQATTDYANAVIDDDKVAIYDCESFFRSKWFETIVPIQADGEEIIKRINSNAKVFGQKASETIKSDFVSKKSEPIYAAFKCPFCGGSVYAKIKKLHRQNKAQIEIRKRVFCGSCEIKLERPIKYIDVKG